ncbi:meprin A subunit beta-like isoform X1 [Labrus mixtus]|uniref:meprin A subunit beta-like isoform X1 n=1 Tax=Labrus mixtus TaxID=508554 RepID=UPI0029C0FCF3|nr:meprin A subunit beta-like isoform X1 [Labrus mixtus]XP_060906215.1 meprin A subunit beta-like isoform X1 [Labrus mixtus]
MKGFIFLLVTFAVSSVLPQEQSESEIVDIGEDKDIAAANKDLQHDDIKKYDIQRSATNDDDYLWPIPVPYLLDSSLDLNAKGVIMKAFDQYRLKSCIDFAEWDAENYYIKAQKLNGCFSYIGRVIPNGQDLSIGRFCDGISTVEHEFLHALGFSHEQSRYDRDNFVTINFENIQTGFENNFKKVSSEDSTTNGVPYDYFSVMHYGEDFFTKGNGSTITTKDPKFQSVIGQRLEMSPSDVKELNLRYQCNSTIAFKMYCGFSNGNMCQMTSCSQSNKGWKKSKYVAAGPTSDHTNLPGGDGTQSVATSSYFMHASTASGKEGDSARLETKRMSPSRECNIQCLQFHYYHSGNESDELNIWIREFESENDLKGTVRLMGQITGPPKTHWQLKHVSLNATKHFQVEFEARKGAGTSMGGFSIDDINLSELECPHVTLQFDDFEKLLNTSAYGTTLYSPRQYSTRGYAYVVGIKLYEDFFGLFVQLRSGKYDDHLVWPVPHRHVTFQMVDQTPNIQQHMSKQRGITSDMSTSFSGILNWGNPRLHGTSFVDGNNETIYTGPLLGRTYFADLEELKTRQFLKGGSAVFTFTFQDITTLVNGSTLPCPELRQVPMRPPSDPDVGPCISGTPPPKTTIDMIHPTTHRPPRTTDEWIHPTTHGPPTTPDEDKLPPTTFGPPTTTDDSIFGFAPGLASCPVLTFLLALMLLIR